MNRVAIGAKITLCEYDTSLAEAVGTERAFSNIYAGKRDSRISRKMSIREMDIIGFGAELAAARLFDLDPDLTTQCRSSHDGSDKGDLVLTDGRTVDVKHTERGRKLLRQVRKRRVTDLFMLMTGVFPTYTYRGVVCAEDFMREENRVIMLTDPREENYSLDMENLWPLQRLYAHKCWPSLYKYEQEPLVITGHVVNYVPRKTAMDDLFWESFSLNRGDELHGRKDQA